jgi:uncharacterized protein YjbI with pentapeptide repeats
VTGFSPAKIREGEHMPSASEAKMTDSGWLPLTEDLQNLLTEHDKWLKKRKEGSEDKWPGLKGLDLSKMDLRGCDLSYADLSETTLSGANLSAAKLVGTKFHRAKLENVDFGDADIGNAEFYESDLNNAKLKAVDRFEDEQFAGANLSDAELPDHKGKFSALEQAREISKKAESVLFGIISASAVCAFVIFTASDVGLITREAQQELPFLNVKIALNAFFLIAPAFLLVMYIYFHFYVHDFWRTSTSLPARFENGDPVDDLGFPWIMNGLLRSHISFLSKGMQSSSRRGKRPIPLDHLRKLTAVFLGWLFVPLVLVAFWVRYIRMHDWWWTGPHIFVILIIGAFGTWSYRQTAKTLESCGGRVNIDSPPVVSGFSRNAGIVSFVIVALVASLTISWIAFYYPTVSSRIQSWMVADLSNANLSPAARKTDDPEARRESVKLKNWNLNGANFKSTLLTNAVIADTYLKKADLSNTDLQWAVLDNVNLEKADLRNAKLLGSRIVNNIYLQEANLKSSSFQWTVLTDVHLKAAQLFNVDFTKAILSKVDFRKATLSKVDFTRAELGDTDPESKVSFRKAKLSKVVFAKTKMNNVDFSDAEFRDVDLSEALNLKPEQLANACGDGNEKLPPGFPPLKKCPENNRETSQGK